MKVYGHAGMLMKGERERLGLQSHAQQGRVVVAARSRAEAARILGESQRYAANYISDTGNQREIDAAMENVGRVVVFPLIPAAQIDGPAYIVRDEA